jgi:hypothetical protein
MDSRLMQPFADWLRRKAKKAGLRVKRSAGFGLDMINRGHDSGQNQIGCNQTRQ